MPNNSLSSSGRWPQDDISKADIYSPRPSSVGGYSILSDSVVTLPTQGTETPTIRAKMPPMSGGSTPGFWHKIEGASPETARHVALRMYKSLKKHGLNDEVGMVFTRDEEERKDLEEGEVSGMRRKSEDLMGMEYLLRDGFVSYLRDVARITPPIPQQVLRFSGIKYSKKFEIASNEYETFGNKLVGCFVGPFRTLLQEKDSTCLDILKGVDGYVMPGSMTLLLGPPESLYFGDTRTPDVAPKPL